MARRTGAATRLGRRPRFHAGAIAFNNAFDRQIWDQILTPRYSWPTIPLRHWLRPGGGPGPRSARIARRCGRRAQTQNQENRRGRGSHEAARRAAKAEQKERKAGVPLDFTTTPEELETLGDYNRRDVLMTMEIVDRVGLLSDAEQALWQLDQQINERGVGIST